MKFEQGQEIYVIYKGLMNGTYVNENNEVRTCIMDRPAVIQHGTILSIDDEGTIKFMADTTIDAFGDKSQRESEYPACITEPLQDYFCHETFEQAAAVMNETNEYTIKSWEGQTPKNDLDKELVNRIKDFYANDFSKAVTSIPMNDKGMEQ